jgi:hypothetical protein
MIQKESPHLLHGDRRPPSNDENHIPEESVAHPPGLRMLSPTNNDPGFREWILSRCSRWLCLRGPSRPLVCYSSLSTLVSFLRLMHGENHRKLLRVVVAIGSDPEDSLLWGGIHPEVRRPSPLHVFIHETRSESSTIVDHIWASDPARPAFLITSEKLRLATLWSAFAGPEGPLQQTIFWPEKPKILFWLRKKI